MPFDAKKLTGLFDLLWDLEELRRQELISNPQANEIKAKIKAEIAKQLAK